MTVSNTNNKLTYTGNGTLAVYPYTFRILDEADLQIFKVVGSSVTLLAITTDYTVTGVGDYNGGNVTLVAGNLPNSQKLVIFRNPAEVQDTILQQGATYDPKAVETSLDLLTMQIQALAAKYAGTPYLSPADSISNAMLPTPLPASSAITTNSSGTGWTFAASGGLPDAPSNGTQYGRQSGAWTPVVVTPVRCVRNLISNPSFQVNQPVWTSGSVTSSAARTCDRWFHQASAGMTGAPYVSHNGPLASSLGTLARYVVVGGDPTFTLPGANDYFQPIVQKVEGPNAIALGWGSAAPAGKDTVLRFKMRAAITGIYAVALRNESLNRSFVAEITVTAANVWAEYVVNVPLCPDGVWGYGPDDVGVYLDIGALTGSNRHHPSPGNWASGDYASTATATNYALVAATRLEVADVQLALADEDGAFVTPDFDEEFARCQRYYRKSYGVSTPLGTAAVAGAEIVTAAATVTKNQSIRHQGMATPNQCLVMSYTTGGGLFVRDTTAAADVAATIVQTGENGTVISWSATDAHEYWFQWAVITNF